MKTFVKFPSIKRIWDIKSDMARGEALPTLKFIGTPKVHGTNAAFCFNDPAGLWYQSRNNIITKENDNAGFAAFCDERKSNLKKIIRSIANSKSIDTTKNSIAVFGEFAGGNIQKGIALHGLPKKFFLFEILVFDHTVDEEHRQTQWFSDFELADIIRVNDTADVHLMSDMGIFQIDIDFNSYSDQMEELDKLTSQVEEECPVGKKFGREKGKDNTIGEGIVWRSFYKGEVLRFKVKGDKHAQTVQKARLIKPTNPEDIAKMKLAEKVTPLWRLEQMWQKTFGIEYEISEPNYKLLGTFLKNVYHDIEKEETEAFVTAGLNIRDINRIIGDISKKWFTARIKEIDTF